MPIAFMNTNKSRIYILIAAALIIAVGVAVARTVLVINYYNVDEGLYAKGSTGITAMRVVFGAALVLVCVLAFVLLRPVKYKKLPEANHAVVFTGAMCGFMFISSAILGGWYFIPDLFKNAFSKSFQYTAISSSHTTHVVLFFSFCATLLFSLLSSLYYFWCASTETKLNKLNYRLFSFMPILWGIAYLVFMYFKNDTVINSQERAILQLSVITVMLCATAEARFHFGIARFRVYAAVYLCAVMSVIVACVPNFLLTAFWMIPFSAETVFCVLQVALAAYMLSRLISIVRSEPEE